MDNQFVYGRILRFRVVDGDTLDLTLDLGHHIRLDVMCRLQGIDAPEKSTTAGMLVKRYMTKWLEHYQDDIRWDSQELDKYRRSLGEVRLIDRSLPTLGPDLTSWLLNQGLVRNYNGGKKPKWLKAQLKAVEKKAQHLLDYCSYGD